MSPCGRARRHTSRGAMAVLAWKFPRTRLPVGASALCIVVLCWLYVFPVYRLPDEKEIVQGVLQQGTAWRRNRTAAGIFRKQMEDCCDPAHLFAMTKMNSPMGKSLWYDGEFLYSFTIDNSTYSLFPQATPFQLPLKKCAVVGNGGILKKSGCGRQIDEADFVMRCNLPPLSSEYTKDVGSKSHLVTANPSIIRQSCYSSVWYLTPSCLNPKSLLTSDLARLIFRDESYIAQGDNRIFISDVILENGVKVFSLNKIYSMLQDF